MTGSVESEKPSTGPPFLSPGKSVSFPRKLQKALLLLLLNTRVFCLRLADDSDPCLVLTLQPAG